MERLWDRAELLDLSLARLQVLAQERPWQVPQEAVLSLVTRWVSWAPQAREDALVSLLEFVAWQDIDVAFVCRHLEEEKLYSASQDALFNVLHVILDRNGIYLGQKWQSSYQSLQERLFPEQDLDELNDTNSFLSIAINSAVKDLEHSDVDPEWFLQNEPPPPPPPSAAPAGAPDAAAGQLMPPPPPPPQGAIPPSSSSSSPPTSFAQATTEMPPVPSTSAPLNKMDGSKYSSGNKASSAAPSAAAAAAATAAGDSSIDFEIVEQVISEHEQRLLMGAGISGRTQQQQHHHHQQQQQLPSTKRFDPKFRALTEVFRQGSVEEEVQQQQQHLSQAKYGVEGEQQPEQTQQQEQGQMQPIDVGQEDQMDDGMLGGGTRDVRRDEFATPSSSSLPPSVPPPLTPRSPSSPSESGRDGLEIGESVQEDDAASEQHQDEEKRIPFPSPPPPPSPAAEEPRRHIKLKISSLLSKANGSSAFEGGERGAEQSSSSSKRGFKQRPRLYVVKNPQVSPISLMAAASAPPTAVASTAIPGTTTSSSSGGQGGGSREQQQHVKKAKLLAEHRSLKSKDSEEARRQQRHEQQQHRAPQQPQRENQPDAEASPRESQSASAEEKSSAVPVASGPTASPIPQSSSNTDRSNDKAVGVLGKKLEVGVEQVETVQNPNSDPDTSEARSKGKKRKKPRRQSLTAGSGSSEVTPVPSTPANVSSSSFSSELPCRLCTGFVAKCVSQIAPLRICTY